MAFHWQTFRTRALTALVFVAVMAVGLLWNRWAFLALFTIVHFGGWFEYLKLRKLFPQHAAHTTVSDIAGGLLYLTLPFVLLCDMRCNFSGMINESGALFEGADNERQGMILTLQLIISIWINDTMAYIVGSLIGKTPFSKISPKKTWEGTIGGALLAVVAMTFIGHAMGLRYMPAACIAAIAAVAGTIGDLFESKLKRTAGVKDSGSFMPGHGGFLDRFDSLLFAAPCVWLFVALAY
ncbi:MAG: phosphatidate cytidylyltransferase [Chitinophagaceae bacterium]|nr:MAG: phosphatidate cytidylyltransferase [Chitinophagaceae bacterium]